METKILMLATFTMDSEDAELIHIPLVWFQGHNDWKYIKSVHSLYGHVPLTTFPHMTLSEDIRCRLTQNFISILNYMDYDKDQAKEFLKVRFGWKDYGGKHYESIYTRFYQGYILPRKFGFDKRRAHLSSMICAGKMQRAQALDMMNEPSYPIELQMEDREYVIKKLELCEKGFEEIMNLPRKTYADYPSYGWYMKTMVYKHVRNFYRFIKLHIPSGAQHK